MGLKKAIATTYLRLSRWTFVSEPLPDKVVVIGAPHTSNWDGILMILAFWRTGRDYKFLVKDSAVKHPIVGPLVRWVGGIAVDRSARNGVVGAVVEQANASDEFTLVIAPKGTRSNQDYWKSGFYRICTEAGLPLQLGFIDSTTHTFGWGGNIMLTGDVKADMDVIRAFYEGKAGKRPQNTNVPRLRAEDDDEAATRIRSEQAGEGAERG
ncbi:MAG: 1-acyl-sn-glycerol-3-phosphate acyltransferase [Actinomycetaceae bacterium]|nr:1-acyl-sn-glycerol-3-phosphate acyltransferase [Actinomycetaceae bacterium]